MFLKDKKGLILITCYLVIVTLTILGSIFLVRSTAEKRIAERERDLIQCFYIAEAGLEHAFEWLSSQPIPPAGTEPFSPGFTPQLNYAVTIDPDDNNPTSSLNRYQIISTGTVGGLSRQLVMEVQVESFARYAYFTDDEHIRWGKWLIPVWFVTGDFIDGRLHTNSHLHIYGDPVFAGPVTSADDQIVYYNGGPPLDNPDFQQGITLGVEEIQMPQEVQDLRSAASTGGLLLSGDTTVELLSDGTMNVTNAEEGWVDQNISLPANNTLYVEDGRLSISGTLSGQLTAGAEENIIITDNLIYNDDPRLNPDSEDMLGLISEENVVVSRDAPFDVEINAVIMALDESFTVERWWQGPPKGTLTVYGGIIQDSRGPVGTFNGSTGQKLSGYTKDYSYDPRLLNSPPNFFPTTGNYVVISWRGQ